MADAGFTADKTSARNKTRSAPEEELGVYFWNCTQLIGWRIINQPGFGATARTNLKRISQRRVLQTRPARTSHNKQCTENSKWSQ